MRTSITLAVVLIILPVLVHAQSRGSLVEDGVWRDRFINRLEESYTLMGQEAPKGLKQAHVILVRNPENSENPIEEIQYLDALGDPISTKSDVQVKYLLGMDLYDRTRSLPIDAGSSIDASSIKRDVMLVQSRSVSWWSPASFQLSAHDFVAKLTPDFALTASQGDAYLGMPVHMGGFLRAGLGTHYFRAGVQMPYAQRILASAKRSLDAGYGGFGSFYVSQAAVGAGGTGYFQVTDEAGNTDFKDLTFRSNWGGVAYFDFFVNLGSSGHSLQFVVGGGAYRMLRGKVEGDKVVPNPVKVGSDLPVPTTTTEGLFVLLAKFHTRPNKSRTAKWRQLESTFGYAGNGVYVSLTYYPFEEVGLNLQGMFYTNRKEWQPDNMIAFTPVVRLNLL